MKGRRFRGSNSVDWPDRHAPLAGARWWGRLAILTTTLVLLGSSMVFTAPRVAAQSAFETWVYPAIFTVTLSCDSNGGCAGNASQVPNGVGCTVDISVTLQFSGTTVSVTETDTVTNGSTLADGTVVCDNWSNPPGVYGYSGAGSVVAGGCLNGSFGNAFPQASDVGGTLNNGNPWSAIRTDPSPSSNCLGTTPTPNTPNTPNTPTPNTPNTPTPPAPPTQTSDCLDEPTLNGTFSCIYTSLTQARLGGFKFAIAAGSSLKSPPSGGLYLIKGKIFELGRYLFNGKSSRNFRIQTTTAVLGVRGTQVEVSYVGQVTTVRVFEGVVDVTGTRNTHTSTKHTHTVVLHADQMTVVDKNALPTKTKTFNPSKVDHWWASKSTPKGSPAKRSHAPRTTTPTTSTVRLPHIYSNGCPGENPATFEPSEIPISCADYSTSLTGITWSSWTATGAKGSGTLNVNNCTPNCAGGTVNSSPTSVTLSDPVQSTTQGLVFATLTYTLPNGSSASEDIGPDRCVSSFNSC